MEIDYLAKQAAEEIPDLYPHVPGELGGGVASVGERWGKTDKGMGWQYCRSRKCPARIRLAEITRQQAEKRLEYYRSLRTV